MKNLPSRLQNVQTSQPGGPQHVKSKGQKGKGRKRDRSGELPRDAHGVVVGFSGIATTAAALDAQGGSAVVSVVVRQGTSGRQHTQRVGSKFSRGLGRTGVASNPAPESVPEPNHLHRCRDAAGLGAKRSKPSGLTEAVFDIWQPRYAARGIATFPVRFERRGDGKVDKIPAVRHYLSLGVRASTDLTRRFADAQGIGLALGRRSGLAVVDVDTPDDNVVADVLAYYGASPLIARSPSGGHHVYYHHNGHQRRRVRDPHWLARGAAVDVLGNGFIVAPACRSPAGQYRFIQGDINDLVRLPMLHPHDPEPVLPKRPLPDSETIPAGCRNDAFFRHCLRRACAFTDFAPFFDVVRNFGQSCCVPQMDETEMTNTAQSAWKMTQEGRNHIGQHVAYMHYDEVEMMVRGDQSAMTLLTYLRIHNGPKSTFMCANGLSKTFGWDRM